MSDTVLITGAGGGIGSHVTAAFAEAGYGLVLWDRGESAAALREQYPQALVDEVDVTDYAAVQRAVDAAVERFGGIDVAVALVGGFAMGPAVEAEPADARKMLQLNFTSLFNTAQGVLPGMLDRQEGLFVGVSAAAASGGAAQMALYAASKAAVAAYLGSLQDEMEGTGVRTTILYPMGAVDTPGNREAMPDEDPEGWIDPAAIGTSLVELARRGPRGHQRTLRLFAEPPAS